MNGRGVWRFRFSLAVVVAAVTLAVHPLSALGDAGAPVAQPGGNAPPVTINSCGPILNKNTQQTQHIAGLPIPIPASTSSGIAIEFVNESAQTAKLVNFSVKSGGDRFVIRDVGTFSPGVSIKHEYRNGAGQAFILPAFIAPKVSCHVASVEFANGSVWRKGQAGNAAMVPAGGSPAVSSGALTVTPASVTIDSVADSRLFMVTSTAKVSTFKEIDNCAKVATVLVAATGDEAATYSVKPIAVGSCTAHVIDDDGNTVAVPIVVQ